MNFAVRKAVSILGSQKKLAKAVGCHKNTVNNWISGRFKPSDESIVAIILATKGKVALKDFDKFLSREDFLKMKEETTEAE